MITTRWTESGDKNLDRVIEILLNVPNNDSFSDSTSYTNWNIEKKFNENKRVHLNNRDIDYNLIKYSYDQVSPGDQPVEDRSVHKDGFIIIYWNGSHVSYIISRNSDGLRILRKMLKYSGKNEIIKNVFEIDSDFFVWLISKVYIGENIIETQNEILGNIFLDTIKGFKGDTEDLLTKVSASGESVINIISTLSFLLESKNLNQIKIDLEYRKHANIELVLDNKGTISTDLLQYQGEDDTLSSDEKLARVYLVIYIEILPILLQAYNSEKENNEWNAQKNIEFLKKVAEDLSDKVENRIKVLEESIEFTEECTTY